jgi:hypothetical protein
MTQVIAKNGILINVKQKLINNMELENKIELNKQIRGYKGTNTFVISLQKQLKTNKYLSKVEWKGKEVKILSDKQYEAAISALA